MKDLNKSSKKMRRVSLRLIDHTEPSCSPPPNVKPATPTPVTRPPTTVRFIASNAVYTVSQTKPAPSSTVGMPLVVAPTLICWKRVSETWMPGVDENPGLNVCPPPLT